jgi:hypothetical protein
MKKLTLDLDSLDVQSFAASERAAGRPGTVQAREDVLGATRAASCFTSCAADVADNCTCPIP